MREGWLTCCSVYRRKCIILTNVLLLHLQKAGIRVGQKLISPNDLQVALVHRDLRWKNTACDPTKHHFYLLDLELVAPTGSQPKFHLTSWGQDTLEHGHYTEQSDLHMLGKMMLELNHVIQSASGRQYLQLLTRPVDAAPRLSAGTLLNNPWIACQGTSCRVAGAQPNQH